MATIDRRYGVAGGTAIKTPCSAATTANITLAGAQTIDGVAVTETTPPTRVLVKDQSTGSQNGIYDVSTGNWTRSKDFDGAYDVVTGTAVYITAGTVAARHTYVLTTTGTITIGTTSLTFAQDRASEAAASATAAAASAAAAAASAVTAAASVANAAATVLGLRLTLTTGVAITTSDVTGAINVYLTPCVNQFISIWDGSAFVPTDIVAELNLALDSSAGHTNYHQSGKNYDYFVINDSGTIRLGTGPKWNDGAVAGSDTARGTGAASTELELKKGIWTNKNAITIRYGSANGNTVSVAVNKATYVGTGRMTADGVTEDSAAKRFLWNVYNQAPRAMRVVDTTDSWSYTTATLRQANANTANQLDMVIGLGGATVSARVASVVTNSAGGAAVIVGIGLDSTSTQATNVIQSHCVCTVGGVVSPFATWDGYPGLGRHVLVWLESSTALGTSTWIGDGGATTSVSGISGTIWS